MNSHLFCQWLIKGQYLLTLKGLNVILLNPLRIAIINADIFPALRTGLFILNPFGIKKDVSKR